MSPWFATGLAPALQPWVLIGAGAATVVEAKLSSWESFLALFLYCVLASSSYLAMEIYAIVRPDQSQALLRRARTWIDASFWVWIAVVMGEYWERKAGPAAVARMEELSVEIGA